jgi:SulP family sulfate permease
MGGGVTGPAGVAPSPPGPDADGRLDVRRVVARYVPIVAWLPTYDRADLRFDAISGIVSWGIMVPVAMAYAGLAGMPPETGLVTAFVAMAMYAVFGTSRHLKVTASSSVAIMSASVVGAIAIGGTSGYASLSAALALMVGIILIVAGAARLGFLSQFLAASVVTGFVIGLAVTITVGQIPALLGIPSGGDTITQKLVSIVENLDEVNVYTAALGIASVIGIFLIKRFAPRIPGALVALIVGIALSVVLDLPAKGVAVVGDVATGVPLPSIPNISVGDFVFLVTGAFGIVFLALAESIGAARSFAVRHDYDIDPNQELIALGAANAGAGLFGGFAVDASFSQSAAGEASGNLTQVSSLITAGLVLATAIVLAPLFAKLPLTVLAAIVIASVVGLVDIGELRRYLTWKRTDFLLAMSALGGVVFTTALIGMAIAVALSLLAIQYQASRPYIAVLARIPADPPIYADAERHHNAVPVPDFLILRPNVPLTFVNADVAKDQVVALLRSQPVTPRAVVIDIAATADLDVATTDMLAALFAALQSDGIDLRLAQVRGSVRDRMRRTGLMTTFGERRCYLSTESAVADPLPEPAVPQVDGEAPVPQADGGAAAGGEPAAGDAAAADAGAAAGGEPAAGDAAAADAAGPEA